MSPLDSTRIQGARAGPLRSFLSGSSPVERNTSISSAGPSQAIRPPQTARPSGASTVFRMATSPRAIIRQAEMLLQITATAAPSPALRQVVAAAYQMEVEAMRDLVRMRLEGGMSGREWFA